MSQAEAHPALDRLVERVPHGAWRAAGALTFAAAVAYRVATRSQYGSSALFWLETAVPMAILAAYLTRPPPVRTARGATAILLPFVAAVLPFAFLVPPFTPWGRAHVTLFVALLVPPTALMVVSYLALNRSYALMAEARALVTSGPYAVVRHPVYLAQAACGAVVVGFRFSWASLALYLGFLAIQRARVAAEEAALGLAHPDAWAAYRGAVGRFWPRRYRA